MTREEIEHFVRAVVRGAQHVVGEARREERIVELIVDRWVEDAEVDDQ